MIYTELTKKAMRIAYDAHKDQTDEAGLPYIFHQFHLAGQMTDEVSVCVALLQDVVADSAMSFADLTAQDMPAAVIKALRLLTHDDTVPYVNHIQRIKDSGNTAAIAVKLADLRYDSDISRFDRIDEKTVNNLEKYKTAMDILEGRTAGIKNVYIEKEVSTGWKFYVLRVNGTAICVTSNDATMPRANSAPIQTDDLINEKSLITYPNPEYEDITITPGLKLEYPVYIKDGKLVAKMERVYKAEPFLSSVCQYYIYTENDVSPLRIRFDNEELDDTSDEIAASIYKDDSFVFDSRYLVEKRYVVSIDEKYFQWLPHIFHAFYLRLKT